MNLLFHKKFKKEYKTLRKGERIKVQARLEIFVANPYQAVLNNHPLKGKYEGYRSLSMAHDLRAIYKMISKDTAYFITLGTHTELYHS